MQPKDTQESSSSNQSGTPPTQHMFESSVPLQTDQLISGDNEKVYAFHHSHKHLSLKQRFGLLSRTRQVLLIVGSVSVVFVVSMITLTFVMYEPPRKSSTTLATKSSAVTEDLNNDGVVDTEDAKVAAGDANKDGVVDDKDLAFVEADLNSDGVVDEEDTIEVTDEDIAWWQELIGKIKGVEEESGGEGDEYSNDDTDVAYEDETDPNATADETEYAEEGDISEPDSEDSADGTLPSEIDLPQTEPEEIIAAPSSSDGSTYTIASWNVYGGNKQNITTRSKDILKSAQILALQEVHGKTKMNQVKSVACSSCAYEYHMPSAGDSYPILWEKALFKKVDQGSSYMSSPPGLSKRYAVWVKLQNKKTGKSIYVINTHFPPGVEAGGNSSNSKYTASYKTHMNNFVSFVRGKKSAGIPLFATGDFNVNYRRDCKVSFFPCKALAQGQGIYSGWALTNPKLKGVSGNQGTHASKNRLIDYVMAWRRSDVTANKSTVIGGGYGWGGSDHKPSLLNVTVR